METQEERRFNVLAAILSAVTRGGSKSIYIQLWLVYQEYSFLASLLSSSIFFLLIDSLIHIYQVRLFVKLS